jgi:hypothetical protein
MGVLDKFLLLEMEQKSTTQVAKVLDSVKAVFAAFCVLDLAYLGSYSQLLGNFQAHTMDEPYTDQKPKKFHQ